MVVGANTLVVMAEIFQLFNNIFHSFCYLDGECNLSYDCTKLDEIDIKLLIIENQILNFLAFAIKILKVNNSIGEHYEIALGQHLVLIIRFTRRIDKLPIGFNKDFVNTDWRISSVRLIRRDTNQWLGINMGSLSIRFTTSKEERIHFLNIGEASRLISDILRTNH